MRLFVTICLILLTGSIGAHAGKKLHVLFIGNSYTYVNNMPQIAADMAASMGDTLVWDMEAPGGMALAEHLGNPATIAKIQARKWDYVVLQEQSLIPAMPDDMAENLFMYAKKLDSVINVYNPCGETMFYMTWGRKNGHPYYCDVYGNSPYYNWPHFCTYQAMDSVIRLRYRMVADSSHAVVSPVGAVWHYIRDNYPSLALYDSDESHPSPAGSYAAACCFYTALFRKDPGSIAFDAAINATDAAYIRTVVKKVTYDSMLYWHLGEYRTEALFTHTVNALTAAFTSTAVNASGLTWHFGDGQTATTPDPVHTYSTPGNYTAMLVAHNGNTGCNDTAYALLDINTTGLHTPYTVEPVFSLSPNPAGNVIHIRSAAFLSGTYQINLWDESGQTMHEQQSKPALQQVIDISAYRRGLYLLTVTKAGQMVYRSKVAKP